MGGGGSFRHFQSFYYSFKYRGTMSICTYRVYYTPTIRQYMVTLLTNPTVIPPKRTPVPDITFT